MQYISKSDHNKSVFKKYYSLKSLTTKPDPYKKNGWRFSSEYNSLLGQLSERILFYINKFFLHFVSFFFSCVFSVQHYFPDEQNVIKPS